MFIFFPMGQMLRSDETLQLEVFLSAPVRPSDILLGKFLGGMPLYSVFVAIIAAIFAAFLSPLGLGYAQYAIVIAEKFGSTYCYEFRIVDGRYPIPGRATVMNLVLGNKWIGNIKPVVKKC